MNPKSILAALPLALAALASGAPASAAEIVLTPTGPSSYAGSFTQLASGQFFDDYTFSPMAFDSTVSVLLSSLSGPVGFFVATFFPDTASEIPFQNLTGDVGGDFAFAAPVTSALPLTLRVYGAVIDPMGNPGGDGSYRVAVTAAVPEPQTYALLLAGLVGVGLATRQRRRG